MTSPIETYKTLILLGMPVTSIEYQTVVVHSWRVCMCVCLSVIFFTHSRFENCISNYFAICRLPHFKMKKCFCITLHTVGNILRKFIDQERAEREGEREWEGE